MATNGRLLPSRPPVETDADPEFVSIDDAGSVFEVLSSTTARTILAALYDEPGTASDVAERVDTSLQNADYHLDRLSEAGLLDVVDTWYSSKGVEMDVYAPTSEPLVLFAGGPRGEGAMDDVAGRLDHGTPADD